MRDKCTCTGPLTEPITLTFDGKPLPASSTQVIGPSAKTSFIVFANVTTADRGLLCCHKPLSSTDCVMITVLERTPNFELFASLKNVTIDRKGDDSVSSTLTAVVQCIFVVYRMVDWTSGFLLLRVNEIIDPMIYGLSRLRTKSDRNGVPTWRWIYRFVVTVRNGDTLGCDWIAQRPQDSNTQYVKVDLSLPDSPTDIATTLPVTNPVARLHVLPPWGWYLDYSTRGDPIRLSV